MDTIEHSKTTIDLTPNRRRRRAALVAGTLALAIPVATALSISAAGASNSGDDDTSQDVVSAVFGFEADPELSDEDTAEMNAESDSLAQHLAARGIPYARTVDETGFVIIEWDDEDDAANTAVDEFYAARYPLTPEEVAEGNTEADALADHLTTQGIHHTITTDAWGIRVVEWNDEDDAANTAVDEFYAARYPDVGEELVDASA